MTSAHIETTSANRQKTEPITENLVLTSSAIYIKIKWDHSIAAQAFSPGHKSDANDSRKTERLNIAWRQISAVKGLRHYSDLSSHAFVFTPHCNVSTRHITAPTTLVAPVKIRRVACPGIGEL